MSCVFYLEHITNYCLFRILFESNCLDSLRFSHNFAETVVVFFRIKASTNVGMFVDLDGHFWYRVAEFEWKKLKSCCSTLCVQDAWRMFDEVSRCYVVDPVKRNL